MKILILGSDGFVGRNLFEDLSSYHLCMGSTRRHENIIDGRVLHFDLKNENTWKNVLSFEPDCIINCIVSGAVKKGDDVKHAIDTNYLNTINLIDFISKHLPGIYFMHFGTAFEYNLRKGALTEQTECRPRTYYGISKLLTSHYLIDSGVLKKFTIIRPFNLFGPYDKEEKIIPHLICAQRDKKTVALSEGLQERDYFFVKDLSRIVLHLLGRGFHRPNIVNAGSGSPLVLREVAAAIASHIPDFDPALWQWGKLSYRDGEGKLFYNASTLLKERGLVTTSFDEAIRSTVAYYCGQKQLSKLC